MAENMGVDQHVVLQRDTNGQQSHVIPNLAVVPVIEYDQHIVIRIRRIISTGAGAKEPDLGNLPSMFGLPPFEALV